MRPVKQIKAPLHTLICYQTYRYCLWISKYKNVRSRCSSSGLSNMDSESREMVCSTSSSRGVFSRSRGCRKSMEIERVKHGGSLSFYPVGMEKAAGQSNQRRTFCVPLSDLAFAPDCFLKKVKILRAFCSLRLSRLATWPSVFSTSSKISPLLLAVDSKASCKVDVSTILAGTTGWKIGLVRIFRATFRYY